MMKKFIPTIWNITNSGIRKSKQTTNTTFFCPIINKRGRVIKEKRRRRRRRRSEKRRRKLKRKKEKKNGSGTKGFEILRRLAKKRKNFIFPQVNRNTTPKRRRTLMKRIRRRTKR